MVGPLDIESIIEYGRRITKFTAAPPNYDPSQPAKKRIGPNGERYQLLKSDRLLKTPLPQARIPRQYLTHSTSEILHENEKAQRELVTRHKPIVGVVVSSGLPRP